MPHEFYVGTVVKVNFHVLDYITSWSNLFSNRSLRNNQTGFLTTKVIIMSENQQYLANKDNFIENA